MFLFSVFEKNGARLRFACSMMRPVTGAGAALASLRRLVGSAVGCSVIYLPPAAHLAPVWSGSSPCFLFDHLPSCRPAVRHPFLLVSSSGHGGSCSVVAMPRAESHTCLLRSQTKRFAKRGLQGAFLRPGPRLDAGRESPNRKVTFQFDSRRGAVLHLCSFQLLGRG